jgi:hypothetical protein
MRNVGWNRLKLADWATDWATNQAAGVPAEMPSLDPLPALASKCARILSEIATFFVTFSRGVVPLRLD